jgi:hypothetical protein
MVWSNKLNKGKKIAIYRRDYLNRKMDAYLEEELIDLFTFYVQNPSADNLDAKKQRIKEIGKELFDDGGSDAMENMFYSVQLRIKDEVGHDITDKKSWWNGISKEWHF